MANEIQIFIKIANLKFMRLWIYTRKGNSIGSVDMYIRLAQWNVYFIKVHNLSNESDKVSMVYYSN